MDRTRGLVRTTLVAAGAWAASSCAPGGFPDLALVTSVRILASAADTPYAKPGDVVNVHVLAFDGRASPTRPMTVYWLPFVCENPANDAYYACFQQLAQRGGGDAGATAGRPPALAGLRPGVDLTPFLPSGPSYAFTMPPDAVPAVPRPGASTPYGLAIVFNIACAGHLELLPVDPNDVNPQAVPVGCFDGGTQLGPDDYVFGFTRVYAYASRTNENPVVDHVDVQGQTMAVQGSAPGYTSAGFSTAHCTADRRENCPHVKIGPVVPPSSQEQNPDDVGTDGVVRREQIWADFYAAFGSHLVGFTSDARLLYDVVTGSVGGPDTTDDAFLPPNEPADGFIWIVVHDNRGGASWVMVPVHVF